MKRLVLFAVLAAAGGAAFGQLPGPMVPSAEILPEPSTIILCSVGMGLMTFFQKK